MRWAWHVVCRREWRNAFKDLFGNLKGNTPLGRPSCMWEDNIKMYFRGIGWSGMDWIHPLQDIGLLERFCEYGNEPSGSIKCWEILE
jgi:hypothetical protein